MIKPENIVRSSTALTYESVSRPKVGMIVLTTDYRCESDFYYLRQKHNVNFDVYVNRISFQNPISEASLAGLVDDVKRVVDGILPGDRLDAVVFNCTAASAILGEQKIREAIKLDTPLITTAAASATQIKQASLAGVDLLCPYDKKVSIRLADYFESLGVKVNSLTCLDINDDRDIARLDKASIMRAALEASTENADGLFMSCTNLNAVELIDELTNCLKKPIFSSNLATFYTVCETLGLELNSNG